MSNTTTPTESPKHSPNWFVGTGIRHHDTVGICVKWKDGEEEGEETIAEVLPTSDGNKTRDDQAAFIVEACNNYESLLADREELVGALREVFLRMDRRYIEEELREGVARPIERREKLYQTITALLARMDAKMGSPKDILGHAEAETTPLC